MVGREQGSSVVAWSAFREESLRDERARPFCSRFPRRWPQRLGFIHSRPGTPNWVPSEPRPKSLGRDSAALGRSRPSAFSPPLYRLGKLRKRQLTKVIPRVGGETGLRQPSCPAGPPRDHFPGPALGARLVAGAESRGGMGGLLGRGAGLQAWRSEFQPGCH